MFEKYPPILCNFRQIDEIVDALNDILDEVVSVGRNNFLEIYKCAKCRSVNQQKESRQGFKYATQSLSCVLYVTTQFLKSLLYVQRNDQEVIYKIRTVAEREARMREVVFTKIQNIEYSKAGKKYR